MSFRELILRKLEIPAEGMLTLAFSGGSDSVALLSLLPRERTKAVYINHNIRGKEELEREIALNRENCRRFGIPLTVITIPENKVEKLAKDEKMGTEAAARALRYEALKANAEGWILTAHHLDDQAETVIMRILSSSPLYKLSGIEKVSGNICRPLLSVPKEWIMGMLEEENIPWSHDSTNDDTAYRRNSIRQSIIPALSIEEKMMLSHIASNVREMNALSTPLGYGKGRYYTFSRTTFLEKNELRREEVFFNINRDEDDPERLSRAEIKRLSDGILSRKAVHTDRFDLHVVRDEVRIYPSLPDFVYAAENGLKTPFFSYSVGGEGDEKTLRMDFSRLSGPLIIRSSREGDRIVLVEGTKTVRALEKEWKVPHSVVLEDRSGIVAVFARLYGGRDRLSARMLGKYGECVFVT